MALSRFLYGILDIEFHGNRSGEITIGRCYFSDFYSPQACEVMSAMDRGLLAGLAGGGDLVFTERITEGRPCCRARFFSPALVQVHERARGIGAGAREMKRALVIGSGAGGATAAKELQGTYDVTVLEAGEEFRPLCLSLRTLEMLKSTGLLFDEREIRFAFPAMQIRKTPEMVLVNGIGTGGSTAICCGNAVRMDQDLRAIGIDLDGEFEEIYGEIPISTSHQKRWRKHTRQLFQICQEMGLEPAPMPKMGDLRALQILRPVLVRLSGGGEVGQPAVPQRGRGAGRGTDQGLPGRIGGDRGRPRLREPGPGRDSCLASTRPTW
jgi:hypothetical protein